MKTLFKIFAGIGALVVLIFTLVFFMTAGMDETTEKFFAAVKADNYDEVYTMLSDDFKKSTSRSKLKVYLTENELTDVTATSWSNRSINGSQGELSGSVTTAGGRTVPITMGFVKSGEEWKIYSITKPSSGVNVKSAAWVIPSEQEQIRLVNETMMVFVRSVQDGSMAQMYEHSANLWQKQFSVEKFDEVFGSFFQFGDKLMVIERYTPQFTTKATIGEDGVLTITGLYPTSPSNIHFELRYVYEGLGWKLVGLDVQMK